MSAGAPPIPAPPCGGKATVPTGLTILSAAEVIIGGVTAVGGLTALFSDTALKIGTFLGQAVGVISGTGAVGAASAAMIVAVAAAAIFTAAVIIVWLWSTYSSISSAPQVGTMGCVSGVVNSVTPADLNPFSFAHGRIDVVVKSIYWPLVTLNSPPYIWCAHCTHCSSSLWPPGTTVLNFNVATCSPMLPCYYRSQKVVNASLGAAIGGTIGAIIGAIAGTALGIAALAALGCITTGPVAPICLLFVLVAILIAVAVVVVAALIGGGIGTAAGQATASDSSPLGDTPGSSTAVAIAVGAYVMVVGNVVQNPLARGSNAIYFAGWIPDSLTGTVVDQTQNNGNGTTIFGQSTGTPDFCFTDPDANIPGDPCTLPM